MPDGGRWGRAEIEGLCSAVGQKLNSDKQISKFICSLKNSYNRAKYLTTQTHPLKRSRYPGMELREKHWVPEYLQCKQGIIGTHEEANKVMYVERHNFTEEHN